MINKIIKNLLNTIHNNIANKTIGTGESCTSGLIGTTLSNISGSSKYYKGGVIVYSNEMKTKLLDVPSKLIDIHTAVSEEVCEAMLNGVLTNINTDYAITTTGYIDPSDKESIIWIGVGNKEKKIITKYTLSKNEKIKTYYTWSSSREFNKKWVVKLALEQLLNNFILKKYTIKNKNILNSNEDYILHQCNCITTKGKGLSKQIFDKYPESNIYLAHETKRDIPGTISIKGKIINLFGQKYPGKPKYKNDLAEDRLRFFKEALNYLPSNISIAIPYGIGCGLASGNWNDYEILIDEFGKSRSDINIVLYKFN